MSVGCVSERAAAAGRRLGHCFDVRGGERRGVASVVIFFFEGQWCAGGEMREGLEEEFKMRLLWTLAQQQQQRWAR